ncbi:MAG: hypothetical protein WHT65_10360 [Pseudothermotoga sp.]
MNYLQECSKFLSQGEFSKKFYTELLITFKKALSRFEIPHYNPQDLLHDFLEPLRKLCQRILAHCNEIMNVKAYFLQSIGNFLRKKICRNIKKETLPLDRQSPDHPEDSDYTEIIPVEDDSAFTEVVAEDLYESFVKQCEQTRTDMKRYICYLISRTYYDKEDFADPSWSRDYKYKIVERTRAFLKSFQQAQSVEDAVMGKILERFLSEFCQKRDHK